MEISRTQNSLVYHGSHGRLPSRVDLETGCMVPISCSVSYLQSVDTSITDLVVLSVDPVPPVLIGPELGRETDRRVHDIYVFTEVRHGTGRRV